MTGNPTVTIIIRRRKAHTSRRCCHLSNVRMQDAKQVPNYRNFFERPLHKTETGMRTSHSISFLIPHLLGGFPNCPSPLSWPLRGI